MKIWQSLCGFTESVFMVLRLPAHLVVIWVAACGHV